MLLVHLKLGGGKKNHNFLLYAMGGKHTHKSSYVALCILTLDHYGLSCLFFPFSGVDNGDRGHRRDVGHVHLSIPWRTELDLSQSFRSLPLRWH